MGLNLQTNQAKSKISITSNTATCSNKEKTNNTKIQLTPKKRGRKRLPRDVKNSELRTLDDLFSLPLLYLF
ncbi:hypothetical protein BpHYR1_052167 [Brachionus plicatilis]|uniref:Uncharacterized protein n=1 Tax=Brachionus plicatilis TaxID=10195 RepID=A0A3M7R4F8_BRAPC|nr:hypothetical protein BpHYR1_052167 [Brachionus plicatilis]